MNYWRSIREMRFEHQRRVNQLNFYERELTLLKNRLEELEMHDLVSNDRKDFKKIYDTITQYMQQLETLRYHINKHESNVIHEAFKKNIDRIDVTKNQAIESKIMAFKNCYETLEEQFYQLQDQLLE